MNAPQTEGFELFSDISLNGNIGYRTEQQQVIINIAEIANNRSSEAISGTLAIELWALPQQYQGGGFSGISLAATQIGELLDQYCLQNCEYCLNFMEPPEGSWQLCLMLREWDGQAYVTRDYVNFAVPYLVPASPVIERDESGKVIDVDFGGCKSDAEKAPVTVADTTKSDKIPETKTTALPEAKAKTQTVKTTSNSQKTASNTVTECQAVSVNNASLKELEQVKGLSKKLASTIYNSRPYKKLEDLLDLKGMGPKLLKKLQQYLSL